MSRRLFGPIGGPILLVSVVLAVFGVLGWVTVSALTVEQAQQEAAARAELGSNLRVALWRLDARMLPALGVEDSRPYYQYAPADPDFGYGVATTPLIVTALPDWMKLHFQLDATSGWESPQVLSEDAVARVQEAWSDLVLCNVNGERRNVLEDLRRRFPPRETLELLTSGERLPLQDSPRSADSVTPSDQPPPATHDLGAGHSLQPPGLPSLQLSYSSPSKSPAKNPTTAPSADARAFYLFGIPVEICLEDSNKQLNGFYFKRSDTAEVQKKADGTSGAIANQSIVGPPRPTYTNSSSDGTQFRRGAIAQRENEAPSSNDRISRDETINRAMKEVQPTPGSGQWKTQGLNTTNPSQNNNLLTNDGRMANNPGVSGNWAYGSPGNSPRPQSAWNPVNQPSIPGATPLASTVAGMMGPMAPFLPAPLANPPVNPPQVANQAAKSSDEKKQKDEERASGNQLSLNVLGRGPTAAMPMPPPIAPAIVEPIIPEVPAPPQAIHLGSMRPHWMAGKDGAVALVLVRIARVDQKTVCQGVFLDWARLQEMLQEEVKDLFPDAHLVPIVDASTAPPDRAMTALPVLLDPGVQALRPATGWTTLRVGLALTWAAALAVLFAVAFCGWTLLDLAERRIRFVSAVTHELRTPLTSLRLYLDLLVSGMVQDETKRQEYLNTLAAESDRLHRLINNVLDFAKLEKQRSLTTRIPVAIKDLLEQLRLTWTDRLNQDGKQLLVISTLPDGRQISTDSEMVQQIIGNLIDNARKYSRESGDPRIWVWARPGRKQTIVLEVEDRGPGVPACERRTIFKPYRRGEQADRSTGGAGLGLALATSWARLLGGSLSYRSADGGTGACFRLELPGK